VPGQQAGRSPTNLVVEAGIHPPGLMRRHADRVMPVHELIVVQAGILPIAEQERRLAVPQDHWVLLRAGRRHHGYDDLGPHTWFYWVCFAEGRGEGWSGAGTVDSAILGERMTGPVARPDRVRRLFEHLLEDQEAAVLIPSVARSYLHLLLAETRLPPPSVTSESGPAHLARRAAAFIADHLTEGNLSTARIAAALSCNADYLGRAFREVFNETPTEHIHRLRIDRARVLFRSTDRPIDRVAGEVGFTDDRYFRRIFKRRVGLTPGQFRRLRPLAEPGRGDG
jgi:AraC-like DNA-binding protein